jgi:uncharacterized membrane-anchored protein YhcB (DUF1043 family)
MTSFKDKIDLKWIFILVLGIALVLSLVFRKGNKIDNHEEEKAKLEQENKQLRKNFDSLANVNKIIENYRKLLADSLKMTNQALVNSSIKIKDLEKRKNETGKIINNLSANGVADEFAKFLQTKSNTNGK